MQELVVESLVVSLAMVVFSVLVDETTQMPLAERDHACETLLFDRPDEPLGIGVEIGTLRRQPNRLNTGALQDLAKDPRIEGIAVVNQMARPAQTAIDRVGHIAGLLLHPRAARLRVDPGDGHAAGSQLDHEEDEVPPEPRQRQHLDGEQIAGRQALPVRLQERLPGHVPAPLGRRVDSVVVQDPLHRGPGDRVAEVRERAADPRVAPPRIVDRHPDHKLGDVLSGHWSTSTSAGAAIVFLGDQSPVPTQDRIRGDDARDLRQDPPAEFVTAHSESTTLGVRQAKRPRAQVFSEDPILLPEIVDQIVLVTVHPASEREDEELQRRRHSLRLLGRLDQHRPSLGRFFAPYDIYQHLMDYWAETMQDDAYLISAAGWVTGAQPREIVQVKNKDKKLVWPESHDYLKGKRRFKSDLVPAPILVARYFVAERDALEAFDNQFATLEQQLDEMRQENSGEDGLLAEVIEGEGDKQKIAAKAVKARLKEIGKDPLHADERAALEAYAGLLKQQKEAKDKRKAAQEDLDKKIDARYHTLTEVEIKTLVVDDKWMTRVSAAVQGELDRVSQTLTGRIRQLAERYATPLPKLVDELGTLAARVDEHLNTMGAKQ